LTVFSSHACGKLGERGTVKPWNLDLPPREWQKAALQIWIHRRQGIVEVVTGGGKTVFAQMCMLEFFREAPGQALVVVPTVSLLDQWYVALQEELHVPEGEIGLLSGQEHPTGNEPIIVAVINSARQFTKGFSEGRRVLLIVDECHRAGSPANAVAMDGQFSATLGLSATPEREYDEGFAEQIAPRLGPVIYRYTYRDAARDGIISPFSLTNVSVDLLPDEERKYRNLTRAIAQCFRGKAGAPRDEEKLKLLLQRRAAVSVNATMRVPVSAKIVEAHRGERVLVFHERVRAANDIARLLKTRGHRVSVYHTRIGPSVRRDNLRLFRRGGFDALVCCRALDEGMNVPEAGVAVIASSTASHRQRIQRLGRILRKAKGKAAATVYTLFATEEERQRLEAEEAELVGVSSVSWARGQVQARA
jgi:superfamily II DNA or RNA helicase